MNWDHLTNNLTLESAAVPILFVVLALLLILYTNRRRLEVWFREWRTRRFLDQIGCEQIRNLACQDGLDGTFILDRIALTRDTVLLIIYKPYVGNIYGAERIAQWTQVIGQQSYKFDNPLHELENQLIALRQITGKLPVTGILYFNESAGFPKGHTHQVKHSGNIPEGYLAVTPETVDPAARAAWALLTRYQQEQLPAGGQRVNT